MVKGSDRVVGCCEARVCYMRSGSVRAFPDTDLLYCPVGCSKIGHVDEL